MFPRLLLILAFLCAGAARADDSFTKGLSPEEFQAAGLGKLTPDELARLDALVRGAKVGAATKAAEETAKVVTAKVTQQVRQQVQEENRKAEAASPGIIERMRVILKPGTEIDYTTLDATLVPGFDGYRSGTVLMLTNGQMWVVTGTDSDWVTPTNKPVHVRIVPGSMGSFFMEIEGSGRPRVKYLGSTTPSAEAAQH
jgi:hypothetical protein